MKVIICETYDEMSQRGAEIVMGQLKKKPNSVLGLATGSTVKGMYEKLIEASKNNEIDFSKVMSFNLDEYYKISKESKQSFWQVMQEDLFDGINIKDENINIPNYPPTPPQRAGLRGTGQGEDEAVDKFCQDYEKKIEAAGGIDLQILGIGHNAHIGFNEPGSGFDSRTRKVGLTESTIKANSRFFKNKDEMPQEAITMGLGTIMEAGRIILVANGKGKAKAVAGAVEGKVSEDIPASVLQRHKDVTFVIEKEAGALLKLKMKNKI